MTITQQKLDCIRLARSKNIGSINFFHLLEIYKNPSCALKEIIKSKNKNFHQNIEIASLQAIEQELNNTHKFGAKIISFFDDEYPELLKEIPNPPPIITVKGNLNLLKNKNTIAIVGSRNASYNGIAFAKKIAYELGQNNIKIVSGLALGIDKAAHDATIKSGTIAVIAGGIDSTYPKENIKTYQEIYDKGLIISEQPFNSSPLAKNFIARNRIISGLSQGTFVIEAGLKSGSLATANFANDQGRQVFAAPGAPYDHRSLGCNKLIKDGAKITQDINDILEEINFFEIDELQDLNFSNLDDNNDEISDNIAINDNKLLSLVDFTGIEIDLLIERSGKSAKEVKSNLAELEIMQKIRLENGLVFLNYEKTKKNNAKATLD